MYIENIEEPAEPSISQPSTSNNGAAASTASSNIQPSTSNNGAAASTPSRPQGLYRRPREGQSSISTYFNQTRPLNVNNQKRIDHQLTKMIVKG